MEVFLNGHEEANLGMNPPIGTTLSSPLDQFNQLINRLETQLREVKAVRGALMRLEAEPAANGPLDNRFIGARPNIAAVEVLKERGKPIREEELVEILMAGGIAIGKKRGIFNVQAAIRLSIASESPGVLIPAAGEREDRTCHV
jgi:hypothetical protein